MPDKRLVQSPYLSQEQAAHFVNRSERTFREYVKKYSIPKYGPARNQYAEEDLRAFMENPHYFLKGRRDLRPRSIRFTPVKI